MAKERKEEERDELGFTASDYFEIQRLTDKRGARGDSLIGRFDITPEQIALINGGGAITRKIAVDCFYFSNLRVLRKMAYSFMQNNERLTSVVNYEDLIQQLYVDLCAGYIKLKQNEKQIRNAIYDCFKLAAVGGLGVLENVAC